MATIANLSIGSSEFDPRFRAILEATELEPEEFEGLEYFSYLPFFVILGATITPKIRVHGDHTHFEGATITVPDDELQFFLDALPNLLAQVYGAEEE